MSSIYSLESSVMAKDVRDLARAWLPKEVFDICNDVQKLAAAELFAKGGYRLVSHVLANKLHHGYVIRDGVGTFLKINEKRYFVWADELGLHWCDLGMLNRWNVNQMLASFIKYYGGMPDFSKDEIQIMVSNVVGFANGVAQKAVFGECLGLFGGAVALRSGA